MSDSLTAAREHVLALGRAARAAVPVLAALTTETKNAALAAMADELLAQRDAIFAANQLDLDAAEANGVTGAMLNRLKVDEKRLQGMVDGLHALIALPDPVGGVVDGWRRPNGLDIRRVRVPLGVIGIIYESRPNVTADASVSSRAMSAFCVAAARRSTPTRPSPPPSAPAAWPRASPPRRST